MRGIFMKVDGNSINKPRKDCGAIQTDVSAPAPLATPAVCQAQLDRYRKALEEEDNQE
jgi:hypothetical protein